MGIGRKKYKVLKVNEDKLTQVIIYLFYSKTKTKNYNSNSNWKISNSFNFKLARFNF